MIVPPAHGSIMSPASLIACHECDLLQREVPLAPGGAARCPRCGAVLYRNTPDGLDRTLAYTLGAAATRAPTSTALSDVRTSLPSIFSISVSDYRWQKSDDYDYR